MKKLLILVPFLLAGDCGGADLPPDCYTQRAKKEQNDKPNPRCDGKDPSPTPQVVEAGELTAGNCRAEYITVLDASGELIEIPQGVVCD